MFKGISIKSLMREVGAVFEEKLKPYDKVRKGSASTAEFALSCLALFYFKWPSLLTYEVQKNTGRVSENLKNIFGLTNPPSDTQMRTRLDEVDPSALRHAFKKIFAIIQRNKLLEEYVFLDKHYLVSVDGTGHFSSDKVHCENCCLKHHQNGKITYYHQMLGASLVHPEKRQVIPFAPEPINKQDGNNKNDCERNASKRLLSDLRSEHPHLKVIIVEDALASNGPHLRLLNELDMRYIIGVKPGDHGFLFDWVKHSDKTTHEITDKEGTRHVFSFVNKVPLNDANFDLEVNFIDYYEYKKNGKVQHFTWITDIEVTKNNVLTLTKGGRARWKIENETFNTLKNQGYNFEHNFGHGKKNLCTNMGMIMLLAFMIDQIQEACCKVFQLMRKRAHTYRTLWEMYRVTISLIVVTSFEDLYMVITEALAPKLSPKTG
jgi:hypothetical protein